MAEAATHGEVTAEELARALAGDEAALTRMVAVLTPVIQARVARSLLRGGAASGRRNLRQEVEDRTQEIFLTLFADDARVLRSWDPERGLSLRNFVGLVAERRVTSVLRSARRNPWTEEPATASELERETGELGPEAHTASRQRLGILLRRFRGELSPLGWHLFDRLFLRQESVAEVESATGMSPDAIYAWRSRLRRLARRLHRELEEPTSPGVGAGSGGVR